MRPLRTLITPLLTLLILISTVPLLAAGARRGWTKVELSRVNGTSAAVSEELLAKFGAERIADYDTFTIVYAPKGAVAAFEAEAAKQHLRLRVRDDMDVVELPGASLDAREGLRNVPLQKRSDMYAAGRKGVFVLQVAAPLRAEWMDLLSRIGWTFSRYVPNNAYLVVGTPEMVDETRALAFVQWLDVYHSYQKAALLRHDGKAHDLLFELAAAGDDANAAIEAIRAAAQGEIEVVQTPLDTQVYARMSDEAAGILLGDGIILSVSPKPGGALSDERQVQSLTNNLNAAQTQPLAPFGANGYWNWVKSQCPECQDMQAGTWKIALADSGLDDGGAGGHADLAGRKFFGSLGYTPGTTADSQCAPSQLLCDALGHGTIVAGVAAGNAATGITDSGNYLLGQGVAPTAGVFITKIFTLSGGFDSSRLFLWSADAANNGVTIQNHSWNDYDAPESGVYSVVSRNFDIAARDADGTATSARLPMLFTVSSGNHNQGSQSIPSRFLTLAGATAKNVLSMGGLENFRQGTTQCSLTHGDSFRNIMRISRVGTSLPGYVKPDLMAPASLIIGPHASVTTPFPFCLDNFEGHANYTGDSGTSFAAPAAAGAALVVKRYLGDTPASISPALTKAVLIAGARSVRGGEDRTHDPTITTIGPIPSQQQGFGRLTFEDILNGAQKPVVFDQSPARTFTAAGQSFTTTVRVRDASKPVKIALVWTDAPGLAFSANALVNDLNLEVRRASDPTHVYIGNKLAVSTEAKGEESTAFAEGGLPFDSVNNVELFRLFVNPNEDLTITVRAANIAGDTDGNTATNEQDFALAAINAGPACDSPVITQQPQSQTINSGQAVTLSVTATGATSFQWYTGTSPSTLNPISGATGSSLNVAPSTTTSYWVRVSNACGFVNSATATLCVRPSITAQPTSRTIFAGQSTTLTVTATNATSFQWFQGTAPSTTTPVGTNSASLTVTPSATTNYWVRVGNACDTVNSTTATVTVNPAPPQIARIQNAFALANSQQSITANWAQPTQAGTFLVAVVSVDKTPQNVVTLTPPAGWVLANTYEWNIVRAAVYYLPANGGGRTSETFSVSPGFHDMTLYLLEYSGMAAANFVDRTSINGAFTNSGYVQTGFTQNTTQAKELVITVLSTATVANFTVSAPDATEIYDKSIGWQLTTGMYERIVNGIGSYGHGANVDNPAEWIGLVVTFRGANPN